VEVRRVNTKFRWIELVLCELIKMSDIGYSTHNSNVYISGGTPPRVSARALGVSAFVKR